jgi:tRNA A37 methylthiotransferase MiaB
MGGVDVLIEGRSRRDAKCLRGKSDDFKTVILPSRDMDETGRIRRIRIARATSHTLIAEGIGGKTDEETIDEIALSEE